MIKILSYKYIALFVAVVIVAGVGAYAVKAYRQTKSLTAQIAELKKQSPQASQEEAARLVTEVGTLIELPQGESPTIATISDREKLKDVSFFSKAENDDKVLLYVNARKTFLYRPSTKRLIEVATLNINTDAQPQSQKQSAGSKIVLRNGTDVAGLTKRLEDALVVALPTVDVIARDNAVKATYTETLVVDLTGAKKDEAGQIALLLGAQAKVGILPEGEVKPATGDFLIIIGKDVTTSDTSSILSATPATPAQ